MTNSSAFGTGVVSDSLNHGEMDYYITLLAKNLIVVQQTSLVLAKQGNLAVGASSTVTTDIVSTQTEWRSSSLSLSAKVAEKTLGCMVQIEDFVAFMKIVEGLANPRSVLSPSMGRAEFAQVFDQLLKKLKSCQENMGLLLILVQGDAEKRERDLKAFSQELSAATRSIADQGGEVERLQNEINKLNDEKRQAMSVIVDTAMSLGKSIAGIFKVTTIVLGKLMGQSKSSTQSKSKSNDVSFNDSVKDVENVIETFDVVDVVDSSDRSISLARQTIRNCNAKLPGLYDQLAKLNFLSLSIKVVLDQINDYNTSLSTFASCLSSFKEKMDSLVIRYGEFVEDFERSEEGSNKGGLLLEEVVKISNAYKKWESVKVSIDKAKVSLSGLN